MKYFIYLSLFFISTVTSAQVFTVTTNADSGTGSLRWAIDQANNFNPAVQKTINFNLGCCDTVIFLLGEAPMILTSNLEINGINDNGSKVTLDGCEDIIGFQNRIMSEGLIFGEFSSPQIIRENLEVNNIRFRSIRNALEFQSCNDIRVYDCIFEPGCIIEGSYNSITTEEVNLADISSNHFGINICGDETFINFSTAMDLGSTFNLLIENNTILGYAEGIHLSSCENVRIFSNTTCEICNFFNAGNEVFIDNVESLDVIIGGPGLENLIAGNEVGIQSTFDGNILVRENFLGNDVEIDNYDDTQLSATFVTTSGAGGTGNPLDTVYVYLNNIIVITNPICFGSIFIGKAIVDAAGNWCLEYVLPAGVVFDDNECIDLYSVTPGIEGSYPNTSNMIECLSPDNPPQALTANFEVDNNCTDNCLTVYFTNDFGQIVTIDCEEITVRLPDGNTLSGCESLCSALSGYFVVTYTYQCLTYQDSIEMINDPIMISLSSEDASCNNADGSVSAMVTGGVPPYIYTINGQDSAPTNSNTFVFQNLIAGTYTITVSDSEDTGSPEPCFVTQVIEVMTTEPPVIDDIITTPTSCDTADGTIEVLASGGFPPYIYTLDDQNPSPPTGTSYTFTAVGPGSYTVVVTDANGCTFFSNVSVFRAESPDLSLEMEPATCGLANGSVQSVVTNGTLPYEYQWSDGSQAENLLNVGGGFAGLTVTDSRGCMDTAFTTVTDIAGPDLILGVITNATCSESDGSIDIIITSGTSPYQYVIDGESTVSGNTSFSFEDLAPGTYMIQVIDANDCMIDTSFTVTGGDIPVITATFTAPICNGNNGIINVMSEEPENLVYSLDGILFQQSPDFTGLSIGTYQLFARDIIFGCLSDTLILEINSYNIDFEAIDDTLTFNFQASPFKFNVITNDIIPGSGQYTIRPVNKSVTNEEGDLLGTVIKNNLDSFVLEYFYHGSLNSGSNTYELNYPDEDTRIQYELCSEACPVACDTAEVIIRADLPCIDNNGGFINTITPNGDGRNDRLVIPDFPECNVRRSDIKIYDRWGSGVFEAVNYQNDWEGKNSNGVDLPEATYYYVIRFKTDDSKEFVIKNFVEILR